MDFFNNLFTSTPAYELIINKDDDNSTINKDDNNTTTLNTNTLKDVLNVYSSVTLCERYGYWLLTKNGLLYYNNDTQTITMTTARQATLTGGGRRYHMSTGHTFNVYYRHSSDNEFSIHDVHDNHIHFKKENCKFTQ